MKFRNTFSALALVMAAAACSQGSSIQSPGATNPGTPPTTGGGNGGGNGGGGTVACPSGFSELTGVAGLTVCEISGVYATNLSVPFVDGVAYRLNGRVDIGIDTGADGNLAGGDEATLTIAPGVTIFGADGDDHLIINRGSKIEAEGSASSPIIFTSEDDLIRRQADPTDTGGSSIGEWGGLVILGQAPINRCDTAGATPGSNDCQNAIEGVENPNAIYGGSDPNDDSGTLKYVQVRFAGSVLATGNELNGISMGGVGSNTEVDFVQVHNNSDDGIEMFGGTADLKHIVLTGNDDDSLDTDNGWQGDAQYVVVIQRADGGDNMVEASSVAPGAVPASDATVSNFTFVNLGNTSGNGLRHNTGTIGTYANGVVLEPNQCLRYEDTAGDGVPGFTAGSDPQYLSVLFDCGNGLARDDTATAQAAVNANPNNVVGSSSLFSGVLPGANEDAMTPTDPTTLGSFFEAANYVGAFGPTATATNNWAAGWTFATFPEPDCPAGTTDSGNDLNGKNVCRISGQVTSTLRLTTGNIYELNGRVDIGADVGADGNDPAGAPGTLIIESGVTIFGDEGDDHLVVNRGSQIFSNGTADAPVIFTSEDDILNGQVDPENSIGEWGGLVILGRAPINRCDTAGATPGTVDCQNAIEGVENPNAIYGGDLATDNSGTLRYTQVRYAGKVLATGNELNGISYGGVGSGTTVDYVQVHNNSDDGMEMFGGTVNLKHIVLTGNDDDSLDTDNGWQGKAQYLIVTQRDAGGDNMVEASSVAPGAVPASDATVSNFTFINTGNTSGNGMRLNTGTIGTYVNGVVVEQNECLRYQDTAGDGVVGFTPGADPAFQSVLFDCGAGLARDDTTTAAAAVAADANNTETTNSLNGVVNGATENGVTAVDPSTLDPFFDQVDYIGAVESSTDTWWSGWSCGLASGSSC